VFRRHRRAGEADPPEAAGDERERFTYLEHGTVVTGTLAATGRLRVHGTIRGEVDVDGVIEVAPDGVIEGTCVKASALVILGRVTANVRVTGKVEVWRDAHLEGDVWASALDIEEGATFRGRSDMPRRPDTPRLDAPAAGTAAADEPPTAEASPEAPVGASASSPIGVASAASPAGAASRVTAAIEPRNGALATAPPPGDGRAPGDEQAPGDGRGPEGAPTAAVEASSIASQPDAREDMQSRT
jgi:cytoskeletal protein CcmA (bactofilin family)